MVESHVYVIMAGKSAVKIGKANDPEQRKRDLQTAHYEPLSLFHATKCDIEQVGAIEREAHRILNDSRLSGEWFSVAPEKAVEAVNAAVEYVRAGKHIREIVKPQRKTLERQGHPWFSKLRVDVLEEDDLKAVHFLLWASDTQVSVDGSRWVIPLGALSEVAPATMSPEGSGEAISRIFGFWFDYGGLDMSGMSKWGMYPHARIISEFHLCTETGALWFMPSMESREIIKHAGVDKLMSHLRAENQKVLYKQEDRAA